MTNEEPKPKSKRGGPRPGAGAPKGNLNALKHGRRSRQLARASAVLAANPETRDALLKYTRRMDNRQATEVEDASLFLLRLLDHSRKIATGQYSPGPFEHLLKGPAAGDVRLNGDTTSMKDQQSTENGPQPPAPKHKSRAKKTRAVPINQTSDTTAPKQPDARYKKAPKTID
jgi:hypothetical protein